MDVITIVLFSLVILAAAFTQALTGFGFALVSVPILVIFFSPKISVPIIMVLTVPVMVTILFHLWKHVQLKRIWILMLMGLAGMPFGTYLLVNLDVQLLKIIIGLTIVFFGTALLLGYSQRFKNEKIVSIPIGFLSGILGGSTSMSGPPVILFFSNQGDEKNIFRANLVTYFLVLHLSIIPTYIIGGLVTIDTVQTALLFFPALVIGAVLGVKFAAKINENKFKKVVLIIIVFSGFISVLAGIAAIQTRTICY